VGTLKAIRKNGDDARAALAERRESRVKKIKHQAFCRLEMLKVGGSELFRGGGRARGGWGQDKVASVGRT